jgi:hypothetical protein
VNRPDFNDYTYDISEDDENAIILRYEPRDEAQTDGSSIQHRFLKWFGGLSTVLLGAAAFAPNALHVSARVHPWIFITFILWVVAFCSGIFNS